MRRLLSLLACVLLCGVLALSASPAQAHAGLVEANPGPGDSVAAGGEVISLTFDEVNTGGRHLVALLDAQGEPLPVGEATAVDGSTVCARNASLTPGVHTLEYSVSSADGHAIEGRYEFEVLADGGRPLSDACAGQDLAEPGEAQTLAELTEPADVPPVLLFALLGVILVAALFAAARVWRSRRGTS